MGPGRAAPVPRAVVRSRTACGSWKSMRFPSASSTCSTSEITSTSHVSKRCPSGRVEGSVLRSSQTCLPRLPCGCTSSRRRRPALAPNTSGSGSPQSTRDEGRIEMLFPGTSRSRKRRNRKHHPDVTCSRSDGPIGSWCARFAWRRVHLAIAARRGGSRKTPLDADQSRAVTASNNDRRHQPGDVVRFVRLRRRPPRSTARGSQTSRVVNDQARLPCDHPHTDGTDDETRGDPQPGKRSNGAQMPEPLEPRRGSAERPRCRCPREY